jgi:arsenate reductase-like glutaredoxin family protein
MQRAAALKEEYAFASRPILVAQDRLHVGIKNELDLKNPAVLLFELN